MSVHGIPDEPRLSPALAFLLCLIPTAALAAWRYVGFQASDDGNYLVGGLGWLQKFPYVGGSHWTLRHPITLPIAGSVGLFGLREFAVSLTAILYFVGVVAVSVFFASRFIGLLPAFVGTLLMIVMPGFVVLATYVTADIVELFWITLAFWTFVYALTRPDRWAPLVLCGVVSAVAFLTRETSGAFVVFVGLMFLVRPVVPRRKYFLIAAGFLAVIGGEWVYLTLMTGNPLYRITIDQHHDTINRAAEVARVRARGGFIDVEGMLTVNVWLDPILNLFITQKYGLLFWVSIPAAMALLRGRSRDGSGAAGETGRVPVLGMMVAFAFAWWAFIAVNPKLYLVPRYFVVSGALMSLVAGWWLVRRWQEGRRTDAAVLAGAMVAVSLLGLMVENAHPRFAERALVRFAAAHPGEMVYTDPDTGEHADFFFRFKGLDENHVSTETPDANALVFYNTEAMARCAGSFRCRRDFSTYTPRSDWAEIGRVDVPRHAIAAPIEALSLHRLMPADLARKITQPVRPIVLYRVPAAPAKE